MHKRAVLYDESTLAVFEWLRNAGQLGPAGTYKFAEGGRNLLKFLQRHAGFAFLMAFVIGWSSVALAAQKPAHQLMMSQPSAMQPPASSAQHQAMSHEAADMPMPDCHQPGAKIKAGQASAHCASDMQRWGGAAQCADCALWHCQAASCSLEMQPLDLQLPELGAFSEPPNAIYTAQHLQGHKLELLRPPKA